MKNKMEEPKAEERYRHFKGGEYEIVTTARDCDNLDKFLVIYKSLYDSETFPRGTIWSRSLEDFVGLKELNGEKIKRFTRIQ